jgi:hypothetical protein
MSAHQVSPPAMACPNDVESLQQQFHQRIDETIAYCLHDPDPTSFLDFEKTSLGLPRSLGCQLIRLFLQARDARLDLTPWTQTRGHRAVESRSTIAFVRPHAARPSEGNGSPVPCRYPSRGRASLLSRRNGEEGKGGPGEPERGTPRARRAASHPLSPTATGLCGDRSRLAHLASIAARLV